MLEELSNRATAAVELALRAGANDVWATASRSRSTQFTYRDDALERVQESTSRSLGLRLFVDGRYSTHSTTDLDTRRLETFVRDAVAMTRTLEVDPFRLITDPALFEGRSDSDLDLVDARLSSLDAATREAWCAEIVETAREHERVISAMASVSDGHGYSASASSNGFSGTKETTSIGYGSSVTLQDDGERRPEGGHWVGGRHREGLPAPAEIGTVALENAVRRLGSVAASTRRATMVVDPKAGPGLLGHFLSPASARMIHRGQSFWAGSVGELLASDQLTLADEPLIPRGLASRTFDGEGIASRPMPIVEAGRVANLYVDTYYGRKAEMTPTTGGSSNLIVALGDKSLAELIAEAREGIYVTSWMGGNSDSTTGGFSLGFRGHLIENGAVGQSLGEMNIAGNLAELFQSLVAVGNDPWVYSSYRTPTLVFENVQFSGT